VTGDMTFAWKVFACEQVRKTRNHAVSLYDHFIRKHRGPF